MPAGDRFVQVPASAIFVFLESKGFTQAPMGKQSFKEVVYERPHHKDSRYKVLVYTSVSTGNSAARQLGKDAIRVVALFEQGGPNHVGQVYSEARKQKRIFRTGTVEGVLERMLERMREAYAKCGDAIARKVHAA